MCICVCVLGMEEEQKQDNTTHKGHKHSEIRAEEERRRGA